MALERLAILVTADGGAAIREFNKVGTAAEKELGKAENRSAKLGASMTSAGTKMVAGAAIASAAMYSMGKDAAELEQAVGGTEAVFKESAKGFDAWAKSAAQTAGLSEQAARSLTTRLGGALIGLGFETEEAARKSRELTQVAADLAATYGGTTADAVAALGSAFRGEFDPAEQFNLFLKQSEVNAKAVEMGLAKNTTEVDKNARAQATLALITEQSSAAQGQFGREADTTAGQMARANAEWENAESKLGEGFMPVMTKGAQAASALAGGFGELDDSTGGLVGTVAGVSVVGIGAAGALSTLAGAAIKAKSNIGQLNASLTGAKGAAASATIAITGVATAYGMWQQRSKESEASAKSLNDTAMKGLERLTGEKGYLGLLEQQERVRDAQKQLTADAESWNPLQVWDADFHIDNVNAIQSMKDAQKVMDDLSQQARALSQAEGITLDAALRRVMKTQEEATTGIEENTESVVGNVKANKDQARSIDDVSASMDSFFGSASAYGDAQIATQQAFADLDETLKENGTGFNWMTEQVDLATVAGQRNREETLATIRTMAEEDLQRAKETGSIEEGKAALERHREELIRHQMQSGMSRAGAEKFVDSLGFIPQQIVVQWTQNGLNEAIDKARTLADLLDPFVGRVTDTADFMEGFNAGGNAAAGYVPKYATGTSYHPGGVAIVGERGPELVNLPRGSSVTPNNALGGINVTINAGFGADPDAIARALGDVLRRQAMEVS